MTVQAIVVGDCIVDNVEKEKTMVWHAGGAGLNLAVGLARLGNISALVAQIGQDANGMRLVRHLRQEGVKILPSLNVDYTGVATSSRIDDEPVYHFNASMQRRRMLPNERIIAALQQTQTVAISSFAFDVAEQVNAFYDGLRQRQGTLFIDPNPRSSLVRDMAAFKRGFEQMATIADCVKLSDEDVYLLYGLQEDHTNVAKQLGNLGVKICLITQGKNGASLYVDGAHILHIDVWHDPRPIVDTMGAGDAAFAAFINWIMHNGIPNNLSNWQNCLTFAMKCAAATCRAYGATLQTYKPASVG